MNEFELGFYVGCATIGMILFPLLILFGASWYNLRRFEKVIKANSEKEIKIEVDPEALDLLRSAETIIDQNTIKS